MFQTHSSELSVDNSALRRGLHIVSNFESGQQLLLTVSGPFRKFIDNAIIHHKLNKVGEAYHDFDGGGFTAVVCLAESHLSIHTWPSHNYVTFDIFLSNFTVDNSPKAEAIYREVLRYFDANIIFEKNIDR